MPAPIDPAAIELRFAETKLDVEKPADAGFTDAFVHAIDQANELQKTSGARAEQLAKGATDDLHGTMISMKEADISLKLVGSVRNKLLDAFHELWRINL